MEECVYRLNGMCLKTGTKGYDKPCTGKCPYYVLYVEEEE